MNPLRLFGRAHPSPEPEPEPPTPEWPAAPGEVGWPDRSGGPATRAARPRPLRSPTDDPPTDPHGWPALRGPDAVTDPPAWTPLDAVPMMSVPAGVEARLTAAAGALLDDDRIPSPGVAGPGAVAAEVATPGPRGTGWSAADRAEATAMAVAFATDYLSWDEADPARRGRVLAGYLGSPGAEPARFGWDGSGRQRAEFAVSGRTSVDPDGRLAVDVRVRVTPYHRVGDRGTEPEPERAGTPAVAPAPAGRGWRGLASQWVRLTVPVLRDGPGFVIARWDSPPVEPPPRDTP
jgi:hypothetical protein